MRTLLVALGALVFLVAGTGPVLASPPVQVEDQVTDTVGALGADAPLVRSALERVKITEGINVFLVLVSGFDAPVASDWATATAAQSKLGQSDLLVAIDVTSRSYEWWVGDAFPLDTSDVDSLLVSTFEPRVVAGAWADAAIKLSDGLTARTRTLLGSSAGVRPWTGTTTALVCGVVVLTVGGAHLLSRRRTVSPTAK